MRTSVSLEPDIEPVVRSYAKDRDTSLNRAINELIRRGLAPASERDGMVVEEDGLPLVRSTRPITSADIEQLEKDA